MPKVIFDYDGLAYTVVPCWITEDSRMHYCGAFATSRESWKRVMEPAASEPPRGMARP